MSATIPSLLSVVYANDRITVSWTGSGTSYTLTLFKDGTAAQSTSAFGFTGFLQSPALDTTSVFTVAVAETISGGTGPYSSSAPVIVGPPLDVQVSYDGQAVLITWDTPAGATVARGAEVDLLQGTTTVAADQFVGTQGTFVPSPPLDSSLSYSLTVRGQSGISNGPKATAVAIVQTAPDLSRLTYSMSGTTSRLTAFTTTGDGNNHLAIYLSIEGELAAQDTGTAFQAVLSLQQLLDPGQLNTVRLALLATGSRGPLSNTVPAVVEPPVLTAIAYDGANVEASWSFLPNTPAATAATVTVIDANKNTIGGRQFAGNSGTFPLTLTAGTAYTASAAASRGVSAGPSGAALSVIASVPALSSIQYDGARLIASWTNTNGPGVTRTLLHLQSGGVDIVAAPRSGAQSGIVDLALDPAGAYDLALQAAGTSSLGPIGSTTAVISAVPSITAVTCATGTSNQVTVTWNASDLASRHGVTGYSVQLFENGAPKGNAVVVTGASTGTTSITATLDAWKSYSVTVQATGTNASGPLSAPALVMATTPALVRVTYDGTNVVATIAASDPSATGFTVRLIDNTGSLFGSEVDTSGLTATLALAPVPDKTYSVQVRAVAGPSKGAWGAGVPVLIESMTLLAAAVTSPFIDVTWSAATETVTTGYEVRIAQGGTLIAAVPANGITTLAAHIHQPLDPAGSYTASVRPVSGVSFGIESSALSLISAIPVVTKTTAASSQVTVTWNAIAMALRNGVTGYSVQLFMNGAASGVAVMVSSKDTGTADIPLAAALSAWNRYSVTVQATGTNTTGPASLPEGVIGSIPVITFASIAGFGWTLVWTAAEEPFVTGYRITVADSAGGHGQTFDTTQTSLALPTTFANNQTQATVQAVGAIARGQPGAAANLYGGGSSYYFSASGSAAPGYLFRASTQPAGAAAITLYLPNLFNSAPSIQNDVFVLTNPATSADYPYLITIAANSVAWLFDPTSRTALWTAYLQFLTDLDVTAGGQPQLKPGAFNVITQLLGRALPLLFSEQLGYVYRFNGAGGSIDLVPGMRMRIDSEARQYAGPPSTPTTNINGFVSSGTTVFDLGEYWQGSQLNVGFNSYLSLMSRPTVPGTGTAGGAAGGLDFYPALNRMPLFRLIYPAQFPASNLNGFADLTDNIVIIGASSFGDLQGATNQYLANGNFAGFESKIYATWFRGRAVVTPEIPILINGALQYVAVGTTLRQLLGMFGGGAYPAGSYAGGISFRRAVNNIVDSISVAVTPEALRTNDVRVADLPLNVYLGGVDALDLPVIQGDSLTFAGVR
ncbi:MAG: fibronectin type III domain-containing protein [Acidobacteriota bacterium]